jgi:hypothetical protein
MRHRLALLLGLLAFLSAGAAGANESAATRTVVRTFVLRWPAKPGQAASFVRRVPEPSGHVKRVRVFVNGNEVGPEPSDYIVACAHRAPSFASKAWLGEGSWIYVLIVLETGDCVDGPTVAGRPVAARVAITYVPAQS